MITNTAHKVNTKLYDTLYPALSQIKARRNLGLNLMKQKELDKAVLCYDFVNDEFYLDFKLAKESQLLLIPTDFSRNFIQVCKFTGHQTPFSDTCYMAKPILNELVRKSDSITVILNNDSDNKILEFTEKAILFYLEILGTSKTFDDEFCRILFYLEILGTSKTFDDEFCRILFHIQNRFAYKNIDWGFVYSLSPYQFRISIHIFIENFLELLDYTFKTDSITPTIKENIQSFTQFVNTIPKYTYDKLNVDKLDELLDI